jgi:hypothetical protein
VRVYPTLLIVALVALPLAAGAAPALPVPRHDTLQDYQAACSKESGFVSFASQVDCVRALVNESTDPYVNKADLPTQLYVLTATKLVGDVASKRTTAAAARVELQRSLIEVTAAQGSARNAAYLRDAQWNQARVDESARRQAESDARENAENARADRQRAVEAEEQSRQLAYDQQRAFAQQAAVAQRQQARANDVANCVRIANERSNGFMTGLVQSSCSMNPNYYRTVLDMHSTSSTCNLTQTGPGSATARCTSN